MRLKAIVFTLFLSLCSYSLMAQTTNNISPPALPEASYQLYNDIIISQPQNNFVTSANHISLLGSCDPRYPLYQNGKIISVTPHGYFSVYVELIEGSNQFVFINNNVSKTITVIHKTPKTVNNSPVPAVQAPNITWDEKHPPCYGIINRNYVIHRLNPDESNELLTPLAKGTSAKIIGETSQYYQLSDYTFVYKETEDLVQGVLPENKVTDFIPMPLTTQSCIEFKLPMDRSCLYHLDTTYENAKLTLYDTLLFHKPDSLQNQSLVNEFSAEQIEKNTVYTLSFNKNTCINGSYVYFDNNSLILGFKESPRLQEKDNLKGVTILLDAGHGNTDSGATGPLGKLGPAEKDINLQIMKYAKAYLEKQGASIITIREDDTFVPLAERVNTILAQKPDLSISIHCNAMPITADFSKAKGFLTFYTYESLHPASTFINTAITKDLNLKASPPRKSNLALTRITNCPALLLESSFLSNPSDYEWLISDTNQKLLGEAIGKAAGDYIYSLTANQ